MKTLNDYEFSLFIDGEFQYATSVWIGQLDEQNQIIARMVGAVKIVEGTQREYVYIYTKSRSDRFRIENITSEILFKQAWI